LIDWLRFKVSRQLCPYADFCWGLAAVADSGRVPGGKRGLLVRRIYFEIESSRIVLLSRWRAQAMIGWELKAGG
jgi:hypothetical protein